MPVDNIIVHKMYVRLRYVKLINAAPFMLTGTFIMIRLNKAKKIFNGLMIRFI